MTRSKKIQKHVQVCQKNTKEKQETHSVVFVSDSEDSPGTIHEPVVVEGSTIFVQKEVHKKKRLGTISNFDQLQADCIHNSKKTF